VDEIRAVYAKSGSSKADKYIQDSGYDKGVEGIDYKEVKSGVLAIQPAGNKFALSTPSSGAIITTYSTDTIYLDLKTGTWYVKHNGRNITVDIETLVVS